MKPQRTALLHRCLCYAGAAALFTALGWVFRFHVYGYAFTGMLLFAAAALVLIFGALDVLRGRCPRAIKWARRILLGGMALALLLAAATGAWILSAASGAKDPEADWLIVLGAGVDGTTPSVSLSQRLRAALDYLTRYPEAKAVLSGGQGPGEDITEAECMFLWLTARGIDPARLRREESSTNTRENFRYSVGLIAAEEGFAPARAAVVSSEFHLCRATLLAKNEGLTALCVPARTTDRAFFVNMLLREILAVWATLLFG